MQPFVWRFLAVAAACLPLLAGCGDEAPAAAPDGKPWVWPRLPPAVPEDRALERRAAGILGRMSLEEKVGQIIQGEIRFVTPADVKTHHLGSVLNGGGTAPDDDKFAPVSAWVELADAYYHASMDTSDGGQPIPVIWGSDAVHGHNNVVGATLFPHNIGLGAARDPDLIRRIGAGTAREVRVTGLDWTFAPTVAVVEDVRWGRTYESYAEEPALVREYAAAMIAGIQGRPGEADFLASDRVVATAKHFLGDGGTERGIDRGDTRITEPLLAQLHGAGFVAALESGTQTIMASFNSWNGERLHGHRYLLTDVLKGRLGFDGFVVGDWNGHRMVPGCRVDSCPAAINAGIDMLMAPSDWKALYHDTVARVEDGGIPISRLDDAVLRILRVKLRAGLFDAGPPSRRPLSGATAVLGGADHRSLAREAVRKSLVLLKNDGGVLPIAPRSNVLVAGPSADDLARQTGGWTLTWQGTGNTRADFPGATSIFEGIRAAVEAGGGVAALRPEGDWDGSTFAGEPPDVALAVFGETPYAEWHGDLPGIEYQRGDKRDLALLERLAAQGVPVVSVFVSGRPLWVNEELNASDAFVAAWLPGSEGAGIADVLLRAADGSVGHDFTGRLSFSWPRHPRQTVLRRGGEDYDPLFPYGYGLSYADEVRIGELPVHGGGAGDADNGDTWIFVARPIIPWTLTVQGGGPRVEVTGNRGTTGPDDRVTVEAIDRSFQEDARRVTWSGDGSGDVSFSAARPQDLSVLGAGGALVLTVRVDENPTAPVTAAMLCGAECGGSLPLDRELHERRGAGWQRLAIDVACFARRGADLERITSSLAIATSGRLALSLADVKLVPGAAEGADIRCPG